MSFPEICVPPAYDRQCSRMTKTTQKQCRMRVHGYYVACETHRTEDEKEFVDFITGLVREAREDGIKIGYEQAERDRERAKEKKKAEKARQEFDRLHRLFNEGNAQLVEVNGYGYRWSGSPALEVGDKVLLPENYVSRLQHGPGPFPGKVTALGSTYKGHHSTIVSRCAADD